MSDGVELRVTGGAEVIVALNRAASRALPEVAAVVGFGSNKIKQDAVRRVSGLRHLPGYPSKISYDVYYGFGSVRGEIGPDKTRGGQAALGNIVEFGSVNNAPIPHLAPALDAEQPHYLKALEDLAVKMIER